MTDTTQSSVGMAPKTTGPKPPRQKKPNYNIIHADPLPLQVVPLPPLIPHNPLSLLHIIYAYLFPSPSSYAQPSPPYTATFSKATYSVNVTDAVSIQGLWCRGFFGKGSLSRSEPTWLTRTRRMLGVIGINENLTAEELTERRRIERREFKKERARLEQEKLERILAEEGKIILENSDEAPKPDEGESSAAPVRGSSTPLHNQTIQFAQATETRPIVIDSQHPVVDIEDLEHLQLTFEEAFFLAFGLGALKIIDGTSDHEKQLSNNELFSLFRMCSYTPVREVNALQPDDPFMVKYLVYHHFRSLGWVVKPGVKFAVDYLLYNRGPAFSHAEFAVIIMPSYSHPYWSEHQEKTNKRQGWHWLHCVNRVSSQVKKTLIMCFVDIPPPKAEKGDVNIPALLGSYKVREVSFRRWLPSRNRD
ncbi:hypothetical protein EV426DRAFT_599145 [Tirmania nivea]|nr:hypothetical protein EV426DRAFT_599145 [Tirmania nivea]